MIDAQIDTNLIFDVGLHRGEDTEFYLKKGFRVVAFEANPDLVSHCNARFQQEIMSGRLTIVSGAIVPRSELDCGKETIAFYRNDGLSVWGTVLQDWAQRNEMLGAASTCVEVAVIDFVAALRKYGIPYYLKIDIEGCDTVCLESLLEFSVRPHYVSIESSKLGLEAIRQEMLLLQQLGYNAFQVVEQSQLHKTQKIPSPAREGLVADHAFEEGASGLFGRELSGRWLTLAQTLKRYWLICLLYQVFGDSGWINRLCFRGSGRIKRVVNAGLCLVLRRPGVGWFDTHARHQSVL